MTGRDFKAWRKRLGLTQQEAADALGVCRKTIQNYENSKKPLKAHIPLACDAITQRLMRGE